MSVRLKQASRRSEWEVQTETYPEWTAHSFIQPESLIKPTRTMKTALLAFALLSCFSLIEEKLLEDETCNGTRREDSSYEFELPDPVFKNVQDPKCDAEWSTDQFTAILEENSAFFSHPFKNVTLQGISMYYCPGFVRFHVSCPKYNKKLMCYCINSTNPVLNTILPPEDAIETWRKHYCAVAAVAMFAIVLLILAFLVCRTNRIGKNAPDEHHQHVSAELS